MIRQNNSTVFCLHVLLLAGLMTACAERYVSDNPDYSLRFSTDTIHFGTVQSTLSSPTLRLMVYNPYNEDIRTEIACASTSFRINVDGTLMTGSCEAVIGARDSMYIFVEACVGEQYSNLPIQILDSISFLTNTNRQQVYIDAYGQDVTIVRGLTLGKQRWQGTRPWLLYDTVTVDSLYIDEGVRVYMARGSNLVVGKLLVAEGSVEHPIMVTGLRTEDDYRNRPGQWGSIIIRSGADHLLRNMQIRGGTNGLLLGKPTDAAPSHIVLDAVSIESMSYAGLLAFASDVEARGLTVANCGHYTVGLFCGGESSFLHSTLAGCYSPYMHSRGIPIITVKKAYYGHEGLLPMVLSMTNSIVFGPSQEELDLDTDCSYTFRYSLLRTAMNVVSSGFDNVIVGHNPLFAAPEENDFRLLPLSPACNAADPVASAASPIDPDGNSRTADGKPDLGAYEMTDP